MTPHKTVHDYVPIAQSMTAEAFAARFNHPFLFGREVLEEEFRFSTLITEEPSLLAREKAGAGFSAIPSTALEDPLGAPPAFPGATTDVFRIRHWVIAVKKPATAAGQDRIFFGRGETNDICVPHKTISKLHAYFQRDLDPSARWWIVDTGSANGTKHNGMRIPARAKVALADGDTLCLGRCVFMFITARSLHERVLSMAG